MDPYQSWKSGLARFHNEDEENEEGNNLARQDFNDALSVVENYALAYAKLSYTYLREWENDWGAWKGESDTEKSEKRADALLEALKNAQKAVALGSDCHWNLAMVYARMGQFDDAEREYNIAQALNPKNYHMLAEKGDFLVQLGRHKDAIIQINEAMNAATQAGEVVSWWYTWSLSRAYYMDEQYDAALTEIDKIIKSPPDPSKPSDRLYEARILKAVCLARKGRTAEAKTEMSIFNAKENTWKIGDSQRYAWKFDRDKEHWRKGLELSGMTP